MQSFPRNNEWPHYLTKATIKNGKLTEPTIVRSGWSSKDLALEFIQNNCRSIKDSKGQDTDFVISKSGAIEVIKRRSDYQSHVISTLSGFGGTQKATAQLDSIGAFFNGYPKPVDLIRYLIQMTIDKQALIIDFFAGSGPLAQAVFEQNLVDNGKRRFVLVQIPEPLDPANETQKAASEYCDRIEKPRRVSELTKERVRRAAKKIKEQTLGADIDLGFRVFKLSTSNIRPWNPTANDLKASLFDHLDHLESDRSSDDILYEILLKLGLDLCVPIEQREIAGKQVNSVGSGVLMACLVESIKASEVEALALGIVAWRKEQGTVGDTTAVFRDSAFENDVAKSNLAAILEQHGIKQVRSL